MRFFLLTLLIVPTLSSAQLYLSYSSDILDKAWIYNSDDLYSIAPDLSKYGTDVLSNNQVSDRMTLAIRHWRSGAIDEAEHELRVLSSQYPEFSVPYYLRGYLHFYRRNLEEATSLFEQSLDRDALLLDAKFMIGIINILKQEFQKAAVLMEQLASIESTRHLGYFGLGLIDFFQAKRSSASKYFEQSIQSDSTYADPYVPLAVLHYLTKDKERGIQLLRKAIAIDPTFQRALLKRAVFNQEDERQTDLDLQNLIWQNPTNSMYHLLSGYIKYRRKDFSGAVRDFRTYLATKYELSEINGIEEGLLNMLNFYLKKQDELHLETRDLLDLGICKVFDRYAGAASDLFQQALQRQSHPVCYYWSAASLGLQDAERTLDYYKMVLDSDTAMHVVLLKMASTQLWSGSLDGSISTSTLYIERQPQDPRGYVSRGLAYLKIEDHSNACSDFEIAKSLNPEYGGAYYQSALCSHRFESYSLTQFDKKMIRSGDSTLSSPYYRYLRHLDKGNAADAMISLDSAASESRNLKKFKLHTDLLALAETNGNSKVQLESYNRIIENFPAQARYLLLRGALLEKMEQLDKAMTDYKKYIEIFPSKPDGYKYLGQALMRIGKEKEGQKNLKKAQKLEKG